jgi:hypothetical protein
LTGSDFGGLLGPMMGACGKNHDQEESGENQVVFAELFSALSKLNQKLVEKEIGECDGNMLRQTLNEYFFI